MNAPSYRATKRDRPKRALQRASSSVLSYSPLSFVHKKTTEQKRKVDLKNETAFEKQKTKPQQKATKDYKKTKKQKNHNATERTKRAELQRWWFWRLLLRAAGWRGVCGESVEKRKMRTATREALRFGGACGGEDSEIQILRNAFFTSVLQVFVSLVDGPPKDTKYSKKQKNEKATTQPKNRKREHCSSVGGCCGGCSSE